MNRRTVTLNETIGDIEVTYCIGDKDISLKADVGYCRLWLPRAQMCSFIDGLNRFAMTIIEEESKSK